MRLTQKHLLKPWLIMQNWLAPSLFSRWKKMKRDCWNWKHVSFSIVIKVVADTQFAKIPLLLTFKCLSSLSRSFQYFYSISLQNLLRVCIYNLVPFNENSMYEHQIASIIGKKRNCNFKAFRTTLWRLGASGSVQLRAGWQDYVVQSACLVLKNVFLRKRRMNV